MSSIQRCESLVRIVNGQYFEEFFPNVLDKEVGHGGKAVKTDHVQYGPFRLQVVKLTAHVANDGTITRCNIDK